MSGIIAQIVAAVVIGLLRYLQQRQDLEASIRNQLEKEALTYANKALEWKALARGDPAAAAYLLVRYPDKTLDLRDQGPAPDVPPHAP